MKPESIYFEEQFCGTIWFNLFIGIVAFLVVYISVQTSLIIKRNRKNKIKEKISELEDALTFINLKNKDLENSLYKKNLLLKEIHHRVKNNLQLVNSLLNIQARRTNFENIDDFLEKGRARINSMVLIHKSLYESETFDGLLFQKYIENLVSTIRKSFDINERQVVFKVKAKDIVFDLETSIPLGLIINELITNSLKHAFPNNRQGKVKIIIYKKSLTNNVLIVEDNGIGFNKDTISKKSFGLELIQLLASQLNGSVNLESNSEKTKYTVLFKEQKHEDILNY